MMQRPAATLTGPISMLKHYADTRYKDKTTGVEYVSPTNGFYGSTKFAPKGKGMSQRGYEPIQVATNG